MLLLWWDKTAFRQVNSGTCDAIFDLHVWKIEGYHAEEDWRKPETEVCKDSIANQCRIQIKTPRPSQIHICHGQTNKVYRTTRWEVNM